MKVLSNIILIAGLVFLVSCRDSDEPSLEPFTGFVMNTGLNVPIGVFGADEPFHTVNFGSSAVSVSSYPNPSDKEFIIQFTLANATGDAVLSIRKLNILDELLANQGFYDGTPIEITDPGPEVILATRAFNSGNHTLQLKADEFFEGSGNDAFRISLDFEGIQVFTDIFIVFDPDCNNLPNALGFVVNLDCSPN